MATVIMSDSELQHTADIQIRNLKGSEVFIQMNHQISDYVEFIVIITVRPVMIDILWADVRRPLFLQFQ